MTRIKHFMPRCKRGAMPTTAAMNAARAIGGAGTPDQQERLLPAMTRGETLGAVAFASGVGPTPHGVRATRSRTGASADGPRAGRRGGTR